MQEEGVAQNVKQPSLEGTRKRKTFWAQCEKCESWRRLPKELQKQVDAQEFWSVLLLLMSTFALSLLLNSDPTRYKRFVRWHTCRYCPQNPDANYNSCSVPQEMSNEAIDRELEGGNEVLY